MEVLIFEEHASVLAEWWRRQIKARTVVYLDAHLDLQVIRPERLDKLGRCATLEEFKSLQKPHHLLPDCGFSYSLEDFLYPAHRLGLIDRLIWVAPPHVNVGFSTDIFAHLQQMDGVTFEELSGFSKDTAGRFHGRLAGVDMTICRYDQLAGLSLPNDTLIDIDTDYFVGLPEDTAWIDPREIYQALTRLTFTPALVTLTRSVVSGFTPLRYRFIADYLAALWQGRDEDADHDARLYSLNQSLINGDRGAAVEGCRLELKQYPHCPATYYLLHLAEPEPDRAQGYLRDAADRNEQYQPHPLRSMCGILGRYLPAHKADVERFESQLDTAKIDPQERLLAKIALGLIHAGLGQIGHASRHYRDCATTIDRHPELALAIGKLVLRTPHSKQAVEWLNAALHDDKTRTSAHVLLGQFYMEQDELSQALHHLQAAHELTPAWDRVLLMLADVHERLGNSQMADALQQLRLDQQSTTRRLAQIPGG